MALVEIEGFDHQAGAADLVANVANSFPGTAGGPWMWSVLTGDTILVPGQFWGKALSVGPTGIFGGKLSRPFTGATAILGCAIRIPSAAYLLIGFFDSASQNPAAGEMQLSIKLDANSGVITSYRGSPSGALLDATAPGQFPGNTWFYFEAKVKIANSAGRVALQLRGIPYSSLIGVNTQGGAAAQLDGIFFGAGPAMAAPMVDHIYIADTLVGPGANAFDDFQGARLVFTRFPSGPGAAAQFTPLSGANYTQALERAMDSDASYNYDSGAPVGDKDLFSANAIPFGATPFACKIEGAYRHEAPAGAAGNVLYQIVNKLLSGPTEVDGVPVSLLPGYTYQADIYPVDPNGAVAWVEGSVNASQIGYEVTSSSPITPPPLTPPPLAFTCNAVYFDGTTFLWGFPAMTDSPQGSISFWIRTQRSQISLPGIYTPDVPNGDIFDINTGYIITGPASGNFDAFFIGQGSTHNHLGNDPALRQVNPITNITSANPAVITFAHPHGIPAGAFFLTFSFNQSGWSGFSGQYLKAVTVGSTTITTDFDSTGFPGYNATQGTSGSPGPNASGLLAVFNAADWSFGDATQLLAFSYDTTAPIPSDVWVNVLGSWQTNHAAGTKVMNLYYGDALVAQDGSFPSGAATNEFDTNASFTIPFSTPTTSELDSWTIGGSSNPGLFTNTNNLIAYMAEFWFAPGQYIDFSVAANRQKFHDAITGRPISLGTDGSLPTGIPPTLYQRVPGGGVATDFLTDRAGGGSPLMLNSGSASFNLAPTSPCSLAPGDSQIIIWDAAMNDWVPANLCALVAACSPTCLPYIVYSNRKALPSYAGDLYTIQRDSDNATQSFAPTGGGDADSAAINTFLGGAHGLVTIWNDQSGNALDAVEDLTFIWDSVPVWLDAQVNGHPALQFARYAGGFFNTTSRALKAVGVNFPTAKWTVFAVYKHDDYTTSSTYPNIADHYGVLGINASAGDSPPDWSVAVNPVPYPGPPTGLQFNCYADDAGSANGVGLTNAGTEGNAAGDNYTILELVWSNDQAEAVARHDGVDFTALNTAHNQYGGADFTVTGDMAVGDLSATSNAGARSLVGFLSEVWIYNCILASADRAARLADIAAYYGITIP